MDELKEFGKKIRLRRIELGMTQDELAKITGYTSRSSINKIEMGLVNLPQSKIESIAKALMVTPTYLLGWESPQSKQPVFDYANISPIQTQKIPMLGDIACGTRRQNDWLTHPRWRYCFLPFSIYGRQRRNCCRRYRR